MSTPTKKAAPLEIDGTRERLVRLSILHAADSLAHELSESRRVLMALGSTCPGLAYPNGDSDARVEAAAAAAGYEYAVLVTTTAGPPSRYRLGRQMISELFALGKGGRMSEPLFLAKLLRGN